jgi:hypothetical protein
VQLLMLLSLGWEGGDEAAQQRLLDTMPLLGLGGMVLVVVAVVAAVLVWHDDSGAPGLSWAGAVLAVAVGVGWAAVLRGTVLDPTFAAVWLVMTLPAPFALGLLIVVRRRRRSVPGPR